MSQSDVAVINTAQDLETFERAAHFNAKPPGVGNSLPTHILSVEQLKVLNVRSNWPGFWQLAGHLSVMGVSGYLWGSNLTRWYIALPALVVYGFSLASMFAPMHECVHRTAFANNRVNDIVAWWAGLLSLYNSTYYRRYHNWHHRYTRIPNKDPELSDLEPSNLGTYILIISGLPWWFDKWGGHFRIATGQMENYPFVPQAAQKEVIRSTRLQLAAYAAAIGVSFAFGQPWFLMYWLLPLAVGQPILRLILLAEHTGCTLDDNPLTNTRTTLTIWPIRFLMWNMPFHGEHHFYPSIPFHALPAAHEKLGEHFAHREQGYWRVNRNIIAATFDSSGV